MSNQTIGKKEQVRTMFDSIAKRYDLLNHTLSMGIDRGWRKKVIRRVVESGAKHVLDVATGTGDMAIGLSQAGIVRITGCDLSPEMVEIGRKKIAKKMLCEVINLEIGDAEKLPYEDNSFDAVTCAFGVRNFEDLEKGISQMVRVLKPGGGVFILEFSKTTPGLWGSLYNFYFKRILPLVGRLISRNKKAYSYLPESVANFASGEEFVAIMSNAGLKKAQSKQLMGGVATIYSAVK